MKLISQRQKGFTIIEVAIACLALGIMIAPVFLMMNKSTAGTIRNRNDILAQQHASNLLAVLSSCKFYKHYSRSGRVSKYTDIKNKELNELKLKKGDPSKCVYKNDTMAQINEYINNFGTDLDLSISKEEPFKRFFSVKSVLNSETNRIYMLFTVMVKWKPTGKQVGSKERCVTVSELEQL